MSLILPMMMMMKQAEIILEMNFALQQLIIMIKDIRSSLT
jgi:hypothetical protein